MQYFVTGATGFIGKRLVKKLLARTILRLKLIKKLLLVQPAVHRRAVRRLTPQRRLHPFLGIHRISLRLLTLNSLFSPRCGSHFWARLNTPPA